MTTSRAYGAANPALTATITGFANGETFDLGGDRAPRRDSTTTGATDAPGVYGDPITCALGTLAPTNYTFSFAAGDVDDHAGDVDGDRG